MSLRLSLFNCGSRESTGFSPSHQPKNLSQQELDQALAHLRPSFTSAETRHPQAMSVSDTNQQIIDSRSRKRRRISVASHKNHSESEEDVLEVSSADWTSATRNKIARNKGRGSSTKSISPPPSRKADKGTETSWPTNATGGIETLPDNGLDQPYQAVQIPHLRPSPIQVSTVSGLPASSNIDTVSLGDILGDPLIKECWLFNYLFDVDFIMYILLLRPYATCD